MKPTLPFVCTDNKQEGSPRGEGNQIEEAEDQGYNPLVPGRVVYIYRYKELEHVYQIEIRVAYIYRYLKLKHVHQIATRVVYIYRYKELEHKVGTSDTSPQADLHFETGIPKRAPFLYSKKQVLPGWFAAVLVVLKCCLSCCDKVTALRSTWFCP